MIEEEEEEEGDDDDDDDDDDGEMVEKGREREGSELRGLLSVVSMAMESRKLAVELPQAVRISLSSHLNSSFKFLWVLLILYISNKYKN